MAKTLNPRIALHTYEEQQQILEEIAELNKIAKNLQKALNRANEASNSFPQSDFAFVKEKAISLNEFIEQTQQKIDDILNSLS